MAAVSGGAGLRAVCGAGVDVNEGAVVDGSPAAVPGGRAFPARGGVTNGMAVPGTRGSGCPTPSRCRGA
ncbi:hypothetical protein GCM10020000_13830 [Streptomyces olivoverticillatus]